MQSKHDELAQKCRPPFMAHLYYDTTHFDFKKACRYYYKACVHLPQSLKDVIKTTTARLDSVTFPHAKKFAAIRISFESMGNDQDFIKKFRYSFKLNLN